MMINVITFGLLVWQNNQFKDIAEDSEEKKKVSCGLKTQFNRIKRHILVQSKYTFIWTEKQHIAALIKIKPLHL